MLYKKEDVVLLEFPTLKEVICSYCLKYKENLFSNKDIYDEIKNIECYFSGGFGPQYPHEKVVAGTIIAMQKANILSRDYYLVNGTRIKLLSVTPFGKQWLVEWKNEKK